MSENKNTYADGMFVREHITKNEKQILNVQINVERFCAFVMDNYNKDANGNLWINLKILPRKEKTDTGLSHTAILDDYYSSEDKEAKVKNTIEKLKKVFEEKPSKTKTKAKAKSTKKKADLPF
tara:strand:- start:937 stop:1305 length:369 start_codon:yes stop_codon:yes gene_type:complete